MPMLLKEEDDAGLMQGMEDGGTASPNIQSGNEMGGSPSQMDWPETDGGSMARGLRNTRDGQGRTRIGRRWPWARGLPWQWVGGPHIIVADGGRGVPEVALGPGADGLDAEGGVDLYANAVDGRRCGNLKGSPPLCAVTSFGTELL